MSAYNGVVEFAWPHGKLHLRFSYERLERLQSAYGDDGYLEFVSKAVDKRDIASLIDLAALASGKTHEDIRFLNPPILPLTSALAEAWQAAWYGADPLPEASPEKTRPQPALASARRFLERFGLGSAGATSGP